MRLLTSGTSPFSLKVHVVAHELSLLEDIETVDTHVRAYDRNRDILDLNPLAQVPTLILDDGTTIHDSRVICEYLNDLTHGDLIPKDGSARWRALTQQSIADGILTSALIARYERVARPQHLRWQLWLDGHIDKIMTGMAYIDANTLEPREATDIGEISMACAISYIEFRFPDIGLSEHYPTCAAWYRQYKARPSMRSKVLG